MLDNSNIVQEIEDNIKKGADLAYAEAQQTYLKDYVKFHGLRTPQIKSCFRSTWKLYNNTLDHEQQIQIAYLLIQHPYFELKSFAFMILATLVNVIKDEHIEQIKLLIQKGYAVEWATVDGLSGNFLRPWTQISEHNTRVVANWMYDKESIWVRRASCVTFVTRAKIGNRVPNFEGFTDLLFQVIQENIKYEYRQNQLAAGWLLRELALVEKERAVAFIEKNYCYLTREALRYATEKLQNSEQARLAKLGKTRGGKNLKIFLKKEFIDKKQKKRKNIKKRIKKIKTKVKTE